MDVNKLRARLVEERLSITAAAKLANMSSATLYRKLRKPENLTIGEIIKLKAILGLTNEEAIDIFIGQR